jgi:hypothetical protein
MKSGSDALAQLRAEADEQLRTHRQITASENDFFERAKALETERHNESLLSLESVHAERVNAVKAQEQNFIRQLARLKSDYLSKKRSLSRRRSYPLHQSPPPPSPACDPPDDLAVDESYAIAVATEVVRILSDARTHSPTARATHQKLRTLADELETYLQYVNGEFG